ncbi:MAG: hypothetical protein P8107_09730 [Spirochaetia bacterium]
MELLATDITKIQRSIQSSVPLSIKLFSIPHETELYIEKLLEAFLLELEHESLKDRISYCLREIALNAQKANIKRVYFIERDLDINNKKDYAEGMKHFKGDTTDNIEYQTRADTGVRQNRPGPGVQLG